MTFNATPASLETVSATILPTVCVSMWDLFSNPVPTWQASVKISATRLDGPAESSLEGLTGAQSALYTNGSSCFTSLYLTDNIGVSYSLDYTLSSSQLPPLDGDGALLVNRAVDGVGASLGARISGCGYLQVFTSTLQCLCEEGSFLNASAGGCQLCPPGTNTLSTGLTLCSTNPVGNLFLPLRTLFSIPLSVGSADVSTNSSELQTSIALAASNFMNLSLSTACLLSPETCATAISVALQSSSHRRRALATAQLVMTVTVPTTDSSGVSRVLQSPAALAAALQNTLPGSLSISVGTSTNSSAQPGLITCDAGLYLDVSTQQCHTCQPGFFSTLSGAVKCDPCLANTYRSAADIAASPKSITCTACPALTVSAVGSFLLTNCSCVTGSYASYVPGDTVLYQPGISTDFSCLTCPEGALCSYGAAASGAAVNGAFPPLALADYWHSTGMEDDPTMLPDPEPIVFYPCIAGLCLAETQATFCLQHMELTNGSSWDTPGFVVDQCHFLLQNTLGAGGIYSLPVVNGTDVILINSTIPVDNCLLGQTGRACSWCLPGWTLQGLVCGPCPPNSALADTGKGVIDTIISLLSAFGGTGFTLYLLLPLYPHLLEKPGLFIKWVKLFAKRLLRRALERVRTRALAAAASKHTHGDGEEEEVVPVEAAKSRERPKPSTFTTLVALFTFFVEPFRLIVDNVQIISSFQRTIRVAWVRPATQLSLSPCASHSPRSLPATRTSSAVCPFST